MPEFYVEDLDIDPSDFIDGCSRREIQELIDILVEDGYINQTAASSREDNLMDITYKEALDKLQGRRLYLTLKEEQFIINLANKF